MADPATAGGGRADGDKRRRVRRIQRYLLNPPMKFLVWLGLAPFEFEPEA